MLQEGKSADETLDRFNRSIEYDPNYGDACLLKSYLPLEVVANLDKALIFGQLALKDAPDNPDSFYALGLT